MKLPLLPYAPETLGQARARFSRAVSEVQPYDDSGVPGAMARDRRHSFDVGWPYRITVSVDDGPTMGPKLQASIARVDARGQVQPLKGSAERFGPRVECFLRDVAGVREPPVAVFARGPRPGVVDAYHFFFRFTALPSAN